MQRSQHSTLPSSTEVCIVGAGIVGILCALELVERGHRVVCLEKDRVGWAQSGRNLGWIRQQGRDPAELPLMVEACRLWKGLGERCGSAALAFEETGINYLGLHPSDAQRYETFAAALEAHGVRPERLDRKRIAQLYPLTEQRWQYGLRTPGDGRVAPAFAAPAIANAVLEKGGRIFETCAVRAIDPGRDGRVRIETDLGDLTAERVVIASGAGSASLVAGSAARLPQLCVESTVTEVTDPSNLWRGSGTDGVLAFYRTAQGHVGLSLCKGFVHRVGPQTLRHLGHYARSLRSCLQMARLALPRRGVGGDGSDVNPAPSRKVVRDSMSAARQRGLIGPNARVRRCWAGSIDLLPDFLPVLDTPHAGGSVFVATGFSGHGFGIAPAVARVVGHWAGDRPQPHDLTRFRFNRFFDRTPIAQGPTF
jgi:glycine/D-amino acid oxidase-like deaminating enzyme